MSMSTVFFSNFAEGIKRDIRTFIPAFVVSYDKKNNEADVQPSYLTENEHGMSYEIPMLQSVPILSFKLREKGTEINRVYEQDFKAGDLVFLAICDRDIDELGEKKFYPDSQRLFNPVDAVIVGGFNL